MSLSVAIRLGRVSNLPTVWTNGICGVVLAGAEVFRPQVLVVLVALSLFYTAGMYLNDAFDRDIDAKERPERPIPSGEISASAVFAAGYAMLAAALAILAWVGYATDGGGEWRPVAAGAGLAAAIVYYNWNHKESVYSPVVMGLCRMLVYVTAGYAVAADPHGLIFAAGFILLCYLIGLTFVAKQENLEELPNLWPLVFLSAPALWGLSAHTIGWELAVFTALFVSWTLFALSYLRRRRPGDIPRAVVSLIAGISLVDAMLIAAAGAPQLAVLGIGGFAVTLALQRVVPGT